MIFPLQIFHVANASLELVTVLIPSLMKALGWFPLIKAFLVFMWRGKGMENWPWWEVGGVGAASFGAGLEVDGLPPLPGTVECWNCWGWKPFFSNFWCLQMHCWAGEGKPDNLSRVGLIWEPVLEFRLYFDAVNLILKWDLAARRS